MRANEIQYLIRYIIKFLIIFMLVPLITGSQDQIDFTKALNGAGDGRPILLKGNTFI